MKENLKEDDNIETYESFDTEEKEIKKNKKGKKKSLIPAISLLLLIALITFFFLYTPKKSSTNEVLSQCLTTFENNKECKTCNPGDKLQDGKCLINHSFKAVYHTDSDNEKVTLFSLPNEVVTEVIIDDQKLEKISSYTFPKSGDHTVYVLIDMKRCYTLGGMFNGNKNLMFLI